jgi:hypothetical protein
VRLGQSLPGPAISAQTIDRFVELVAIGLSRTMLRAR